MPIKDKSNYQHVSSRRQFLKTASIVAAASGVATNAMSQTATPHVGGRDTLRIGVVGCGGRGTGAVLDALQADPHIQLTAIADVFGDRIDLCLQSLAQEKDVAGKIDVPKKRQFSGFNAYQELIESGVDVVLLATPPHFRPLHLRAAIEGGKHVFCEKPVAVDAPGVRSVLESCRRANERKLSIVSGLCYRDDPGFNEAIDRIHDGEIGEVRTLYANDYRGTLWEKPRQHIWSDMENQLRNWYYYTWLSGDFNVEQHIHFLDVCAWVKQSYPDRAIGIGGRQARTQEKYGNIYDHHSVTYEYLDGTRLVSNCRQQAGCSTDTRSFVQGSHGCANLDDGNTFIDAEGKWRYRKKRGQKSIYQLEHDRLFSSIRNGRPVNDGEYMSNSTLLAIMGRMATYTGEAVTWEQAMNSKEDLSPPEYAWGDAPEVVIAVPGVTELI
ncbi:Gfo/Idh/MocA family protein [Bythopirellula goksoeyrii]|uniref:Inositol 2-dehydrogenase n=1 Tax=Bythopirellula goksoeyrii TaxID=1400387 RepID=A0A5B9QF54_9BACT|nr:Gfo/Idh/MocA family oxidoreductase [Bythopirellula goksoeyrii]QEG36280.1 Inositol 2-dehydrogenase [Bythopirellula goksoeyrii]